MSRVDLPGTMKCGHPLAARKIESVYNPQVWGGRQLRTVCWACEVARLPQNAPERPQTAGSAHK